MSLRDVLREPIHRLANAGPLGTVIWCLCCVAIGQLLRLIWNAAVGQ